MKRWFNRASKAQVRRLVLPGLDAWERWVFVEGEAAKLEASGDLAEVCTEAVEWLGLPHFEVLVTPLALKSADAALFPSVVDLHWERRGLASLEGSKQAGGHVALAIGEEESRLVAFRTAVDEPESYAYPTVGRAAPAAWMRAWPRCRLVVSRELGRTFLLITSDQGQVIYQSPLCTGRPGAAALAQLRAVLQSLSDEGWLDGLAGIDVLIPLTPPEMTALHQATGLPVRTVGLPPPIFPPDSMALSLPALEAIHQAAKRHALQRKILGSALVIVVLLGLVAAIRALALSLEVEAEESWLTQHRAETVRLQEIARTWSQVEDAIDPERFVLETFFRVTQAMPSGSVRLIRFEAKDGKLAIRGEAQNPQAAFGFLSQLQQSPDLEGYRWTMPGPSLQPNDLALFQIEGLSPYASPPTQ